MSRIHVYTILELGDDGEFFIVADHSFETDFIPIRADRSTGAQAYKQGQQAAGVGAQQGTQANQIGSSIIPTLERRAQGQGVGLTPLQRNQALVSSQEATGGTNAGLTGEANLASARTRSAGGYGAALDEASRQKMRSQQQAVQGVNTENTQLANQQQSQALQQLQGLYGTDTSNMLKAMGLQSEDTQNQLAAARQGWLQNTTGVIGALKGAGASGGGGSSGVAPWAFAA